LTLCVTWSITLWASISVHVNKRLGVNIWIFLAMFLMPLQGFMNAVIFFTPKISSWVEKRWKKLKLCCCSTTNTMHTADAHTSVLAPKTRERRPRKKTVSFHDNPPIAGHIINQQLQGEGGLIQVGSRQQYSDQTDQELGEASFIIAPKRTWRIWNPVQSSRIESRRGASSFVEDRKSWNFWSSKESHLESQVDQEQLGSPRVLFRRNASKGRNPVTRKQSGLSPDSEEKPFTVVKKRTMAFKSEAIDVDSSFVEEINSDRDWNFWGSFAQPISEWEEDQELSPSSACEDHSFA